MTPQSPLPVSVCLIVKDEAERLERSIGPFRGRVGEIIAYDSGSSDGTLELLKKLGVTVRQGPWMGFSQTRQQVWSMAAHDWILWLDADEIFSAETIDALEEIRSGAPAAGYKVCRQVVFQGKRIRHGDWFPDWVLRVFRRDNFKMEDRLVHESVQVDGRVAMLPGIVEHHSFRNWEDLERRSRRYVELWSRQGLAAHQASASPSLRAAARFLRGYVVKSGWLDGPLGFKIALHNAKEVYHKHRALRKLRGEG